MRNKYIFFMIFTVIIMFIGITKINADGYFTDGEGNTGDYLSCTYSSSDTIVSISFVYKNGEIEKNFRIGNENDAIEFDNSEGASPLVNTGEVDDYVLEYKKCPSTGIVKHGQVPTGAPGSGQFKDEYIVWLGSGNEDACEDNLINGRCRELTFYKASVDQTEDDSRDSAEEDRGDALIEFAKEEIEDEYITITEGCGIISGEVEIDGEMVSLQDILHDVLVFIRIAGIILVVVLGAIDFVRSVTSFKDDELKKSWGRFLKRIIALACLLILPTIIEFLLTNIDITGVNDNSIFCDV